MESQSARIRKAANQPGVYFVDGETWQVGEKYTLLKLLGGGSFSSVCLATDNDTGEKVALKRIPDVLKSPEQAKRVLREVCILRRLDHPTIIGLKDAFVRPSASGPYRFRNGRLESTSLDVFIVLEFADGGDLFNFRGQLSIDEVRLLMWQLLHALKFLHANHVWHRDIKSSNVLLTTEGGMRLPKLADFGSARSANQEGYHWAEQHPPTTPRHPRNPSKSTGQPPSAPTPPPTTATPWPPQPPGRVASGTPSPSPRGGVNPTTGGPGPSGGSLGVVGGGERVLHHADSFQTLGPGGEVQTSDLYVALGKGGSGLSSPLTRMVATPCYRAPEVVMSRGGYTSAIDMWSLGCIFGELLQRVARVGSATTPHLQVPPLFAIHGMPKTPGDGDRFTGSEAGCSSTTRKELAALFDVIGTPTWADVDAVQSPAWRSYLQRLPGKAPTLFRRLGVHGESTVHLLSRMLAFDPERRCSAEEALQHEYFAFLEASQQQPAAGSPPDELAQGVNRMDLDAPKRARGSEEPLPAPLQAIWTALSDAEQKVAKRARCNGSGDGGPSRGGSGEGFLGYDGDGVDMEASGEKVNGGRRHYYEEQDPARGLAMLEEEMAGVRAGEECAIEACLRDDEGCALLRQLLEQECTAVHADCQRRCGSAGGETPKPGTPSANSVQRVASESRLRHLATAQQSMLASWGGDGHLQEDRAHTVNDPAEYGGARIHFTADAAQGKLDPAEYLKVGRHGEWTSHSGTGPLAGPAWGVANLPPGLASTDPAMVEAIRRQQLR